MKVIDIDNCMDCPLSEIGKDGIITCKSGSVGSREIGNIFVDTSIPDWCPLQDFKDFVADKVKTSVKVYEVIYDDPDGEIIFIVIGDITEEDAIKIAKERMVEEKVNDGLFFVEEHDAIWV